MHWCYFFLDVLICLTYKNRIKHALFQETFAATSKTPFLFLLPDWSAAQRPLDAINIRWGHTIEWHQVISVKHVLQRHEQVLCSHLTEWPQPSSSWPSGRLSFKKGDGYHRTSCLFWSLLLVNTLKDVGGCDVHSSSLFVTMDALSIWSVIRLPNLQIFIQCKNTGSTIVLQEWTARDWHQWMWIYLSVAKLEFITALQSQRWLPVVFDEMSKNRYYKKKGSLNSSERVDYENICLTTTGDYELSKMTDSPMQFSVYWVREQKLMKFSNVCNC